MQLQTLHRWDITPTEAVQLQRQLASRVLLEPLPSRTPRLIAGVDVSILRGDPTLTAGVIVWDAQTGGVVDSAAAKEPERFPYVPGLLSFREIPALASAIAGLKTMPDVWFVDGQGVAHPRRLGIAAHLGILLDMPTIGIGKSKLCGTFEPPGPNIGDHSPLIHQGEIIGSVLRTKARSNPLIISPGHRASYEDAVALALSALRGYRLPEPTRLAHLYVNAVRRGEKPTFASSQATLF